MFCLPPELVDKFLAGVKSGQVVPEKLVTMTSEERRSFFTGFVGDSNAKSVNALFESKLLLKNQQRGIIAWAKTVGGLKPEAQRDIVSRVQRMTTVLEPKDYQSFLADLAEQRLGLGVSLSEANRISQLAKVVAQKKAAMLEGGDRLDYGRARVAFTNYVNDLKNQANKLTISEAVRSPGKTAVRAVSETAGTAKSIKASMDNSAIFRQGWKALWTHPGIWLKNAKQSFVNIWNTFGGKAVMDELNADIVSRPNFDLMKKARLALGNIEEAYPTHLPEKIPFLGRAYKASQTAFEAFQFKNRADIFDKYIEIARNTGVELTDQELQAIGKLVNSLTGRGSLGALEPAANVVNNVFFSPRFAKSHIDTLLLHPFDEMSSFTRKEAAKNLLKIVAGTAAVLGTARAISPDSVELDPRSAGFGKIKVGNTRFEVSGGMASIVTLASRLLTMSSKSSTTGQVNPLNSGKFGAQTGVDVVYNFLENKLSPAASVVRDLMQGRDFQGNKPTIVNEAMNLFVPLPITNYLELKNDPKSANKLVAVIADALGIGTNTYSPKANWDTSTSKELTEFRERVGDQKFKEANDQYNKEYNAWVESVLNIDRFQSLSDDERQRVVNKKKDEIRTRVLRNNGFIYREKESKPIPRS